MKSDFTVMKDRALAEPTLEKALSVVAEWEIKRIAEHAKCNADPIDPSFEPIFKMVIAEYGSTTDTP